MKCIYEETTCKYGFCNNLKFCKNCRKGIDVIYQKQFVTCEKLPIFFVNRENSFAGAILLGLEYCDKNKSAFGFDIFFANNEKSIKIEKSGAPISAITFYKGSGKERNKFYIMGHFKNVDWIHTPYILPSRIKKDILKKQVSGALGTVFDFVSAYKTEISAECY